MVVLAVGVVSMLQVAVVPVQAALPAVAVVPVQAVVLCLRFARRTGYRSLRFLHLYRIVDKTLYNPLPLTYYAQLLAL